MMPDFLTGDVKDFILKLLVKDPRKRLGGDPSDAEAVKNHKFFVPSLNWDDLLRKNIPAPFIPRISAAMDVSNFSEEFTNMPAVDSPSVAPPNVENVFSGYSYVAPSVVLEHYTTTVPTASNAPSLPIGSSRNSIESHQETDSAQNKINAHRVILTPEEEEDMFRPNPDKRPSASNLVGCKLQVYISSYIPTFVSILTYQITIITLISIGNIIFRTRPFFASMILIFMTRYLEMGVFQFAGVVYAVQRDKNSLSK